MPRNTLRFTTFEPASGRPLHPRRESHHLTETVDGRTGRIWAYGQLNDETAGKLGRTVAALTHCGHKRIVLDLRGMDEPDGAGRRALQRLRGRVLDTGGHLILIHALQSEAG